MAAIIMIQGTASGVGKTILTTALCRIFTQDGYKTAPFKSQNMTSVSHILPDGREMARSQAIAAYACNIEPTSDMNPILLKMSADGTDVIINGESVGIMDSTGCSGYKKHALASALKAFKRLSELYDVIVIEGAGSPVELNLNNNDIANMGLAKAVGAPVLLASDISCGGVFASLYGTIELLQKNEKQLIKGVVVNKFKGSKEHLGDAVSILEEICSVPVLGIIPYTDIALEDEDSLSSGFSESGSNCISNAGLRENNEQMQAEFERIAGHFRANLNMKGIYCVLNGKEICGVV